jgi:predicted RNA-binding Zn ribbon-like protein
MPHVQQHLGGILCLDFINMASGSDDPGHDPQGPEMAPGNVARVQRFRAMLRRLLEAEARGLGASADDLAALNKILSMSGAHRGLIPTVRGYGWGWLEGPAGRERFLWPVAFSAARLLEGPDLARLKACDGCGRLFLDASHNRSRRWCDMQGCGNRAKAARYRTRKD